MIIPFEGKIPKIHPTAWLAETAVIIGDVEIGENSSVWYNCVLRGDNMPIRIGKNTNILDGSILHIETDKHSCILGDNVSIGHNAIVHGCDVKDGSLVAMGATVLNGVEVGEGSVIGAGSVVPEYKIIEANTLWMGVPAKYVRHLKEEETQRFSHTAIGYSKLKDRFKKSV